MERITQTDLPTPDNEHLRQFSATSNLNDHLHWKGNNLREWCRSVFKWWSTQLKSETVNREQLKTMCAVSSGLCDMDVFAAVMAWGGMHRENGRRLKERDIEGIRDIIAQLRGNKLPRTEAYSRFYDFRRDGKLSGLGPAYYTKLIFFCSPAHDGYIMDQWTAKSINLIFGHCLVDLSRPGYVKHGNPPQRYETFCKAVEALTVEIGESSAENTEIRLFSNGREKGDWRNYVVRNWKPGPKNN